MLRGWLSKADENGTPVFIDYLKTYELSHPGLISNPPELGIHYLVNLA